MPVKQTIVLYQIPFMYGYIYKYKCNQVSR